MPLEFDSSLDHYRRILGVLFYVGPIEGLLDRTMCGGLIVVPSAPVLVNLPVDPAHRQAIESSDLAVTDSGFMVLLWRLFTRERLIRISGLRYLRALMEDSRFRDCGSILWVMPSAVDAKENRAWLQGEGVTVAEEDCYLAPHYARQGPLEDPALLALIEARRPRFVMINLGGGVQERLGWYLREALKTTDDRRQTTEDRHKTSDHSPLPSDDSRPTSETSLQALKSRGAEGTLREPITNNSELLTDDAAAPVYRPALICTGAAIAFLSNRQVNIPPWADRLFLGWLVRILSEPAKFLPRYWHSLRLAALLWKHGSSSVASRR